MHLIYAHKCSGFNFFSLILYLFGFVPSRFDRSACIVICSLHCHWLKRIGLGTTSISITFSAYTSPQSLDNKSHGVFAVSGRRILLLAILIDWNGDVWCQ